jgi:hypothetical protein
MILLLMFWFCPIDPVMIHEIWNAPIPILTQESKHKPKEVDDGQVR